MTNDKTARVEQRAREHLNWLRACADDWDHTKDADWAQKTRDAAEYFEAALSEASLRSDQGGGVELFDREPNLGARTAEPSLRAIVTGYYKKHLADDKAERLTSDYLNALRSDQAPTEPISATPENGPTVAGDEREGERAVERLLQIKDFFNATGHARWEADLKTVLKALTSAQSGKPASGVDA